jgi:hypothetical protein
LVGFNSLSHGPPLQLIKRIRICNYHCHCNHHYTFSALVINKNDSYRYINAKFAESDLHRLQNRTEYKTHISLSRITNRASLLPDLAFNFFKYLVPSYETNTLFSLFYSLLKNLLNKYTIQLDFFFILNFLD